MCDCGVGLRHQIGAQLARPRHRRRQADAYVSPGASVRRRASVERQQVAALGRRQRVHLVEDDGIEIGEQVRRCRHG